MKRLLWLAGVFAGAACTLLTQFDPEGQPCDTNAPRATQCLSGYHCVAQGCTKGALTDAGTEALDAGTTGPLDAGRPVTVDAGMSPPDAGPKIIDSGTAMTDAGAADGG